MIKVGTICYLRNHELAGRTCEVVGPLAPAWRNSDAADAMGYPIRLSSGEQFWHEVNWDQCQLARIAAMESSLIPISDPDMETQLRNEQSLENLSPFSRELNEAMRQAYQAHISQRLREALDRKIMDDQSRRHAR